MTALGKYEILEKLGEGATAVVYRARDTVLGREVALKVFNPLLTSDVNALMRFAREAQATTGLIHPNIATVFETGEAEGRYFMAMNYINGQSLDKVLQTRTLTWLETLRLAQQIGSALDFAHNNKLIHRDVKPGNIIRTPKGDFVLIDFGITHALMQTPLTTHTGAVLGTPSYIAPEIWDGKKASSASDQYSLACIVYEALTGLTLFIADTPPAIMTLHTKGPQLPKVWPIGVPAKVRKILLKALEKNPQNRYPTASALHKALKDLTSETQSNVGPNKVAFRWFALAGAIIAGAVGCAVLSVYWLLFHRQLPTDQPTVEANTFFSLTNTAIPSPSYPDLVISDVKPDAASSSICNDVFHPTYSVTILNQGETDAGNFVVNILGNIQTIPGLGAGQSIILSGTSEQGGSTLSVDAYQEVPETKEDNNIFRSTIPTSIPYPTCTLTPLPTDTFLPSLTPRPLPSYTITINPTPIPPTPIPPTPIPTTQVPPTQPLPPGENLLKNAGFEDGGTREFLGWTFSPDNRSCSRAQHENTWPFARAGSARFLSAGRSSVYPNCSSVWQEVNVVPLVNQTYTAGFWLRNGGNENQFQNAVIALWGTRGPNPESASASVTLQSYSWSCHQLWFTPTRSDNTVLKVEIYLDKTWVMDVQADDLYLGYGAVQYCP